jgi:hypothetical protein
MLTSFRRTAMRGESAMKVVVVVIAALITLSLAALGMVAAEKAMLPSSVARAGSPDQGKGASAAQPARIVEIDRRTGLRLRAGQLGRQYCRVRQSGRNGPVAPPHCWSFPPVSIEHY